MYKLKKYKKYILIIISFIILSVLSAIFLICSNKLYGATDMQFHVKRILELRSSLKHFQLIPLFSFNYFHGSIIMGLYSYFILYPFIVILYFVHSFIYAYYYFFSLIVLVSLIVSFFSSLSFSKSILISYLFSITYSMSSVFIQEYFLVGDIGVTTAMVFLPMVAFGIIYLLRNNNYMCLTMGMVAILYCQLSAFAIMLGFVILCILMNYKCINKCVIKSIVKSLFFIITLTSFIWIPILNIYLYKNQIHSVVPVQLTGFNIKAFFASVSIFSIITIILLIPLFKCLNKYNKQMYFLSILIIICSSKLMPWYLLTSMCPILNEFQFTLRFLIIPQVLLSYLFSVIIVYYVKWSKVNKDILIGLVLIIIVIFQLFSQFYIIHRGNRFNIINNNSYRQEKISKLHYSNLRNYILDNNNQVTILSDSVFNNHDYYPKFNYSVNKYINNNLGYSDKKLIKIHHVGYNTFKFNYMYTTKKHKLILPLIYYKGERLKLYLNSKLIRYRINKNKSICINENFNKNDNVLHVSYSNNLIIIEIFVCLFGFLFIILRILNIYG